MIVTTLIVQQTQFIFIRKEMDFQILRDEIPSPKC